MRQKQNQVASDAGRLHGPRDAAGNTLEEVMSQLVGAATGLENREAVTVEVVSPLLQLKDGQTPGDVLAGEFLFHFGGFLDVRFRENDFALGYGNMQCWIETELEKHLQGAGDLDAAKAAVAGRANPEWANLELGKASIGTLSIAEKWEVSKLALHVAHVIASDIHNG